MAKKIMKTVGRYTVVSGKFFDMYFDEEIIMDCSKTNKKWNLMKSTKEGRFKLSSHPSRGICRIALEKELGI